MKQSHTCTCISPWQHEEELLEHTQAMSHTVKHKQFEPFSMFLEILTNSKLRTRWIQRKGNFHNLF